ncbi:MAG: efflux RND transporter permease subunit [Acidobacteriota bacterium]|nr:efflux RND transporter permease subunit [Acidobacteriota bacterium]
MAETRVNPIVRYAVSHPVTLGMALLGVLVLGALSLSRLPLEFLPTFSSSNISVNAPYPSSSPQEVERLVVRPLEASLSTINGVETLSANASPNGATLNLSFLDGTDMDLAAVEVRDRIDRVRNQLPDDLERLTIRRFQSTDIPILRADLSASWPRDELYDFAERVLSPRLERLEGVAQVNVEGLLLPELQINLDPARLEAHGIDSRTLGQVLRNNHLNLSAGHLDEGNRKLLVRTLGEVQSPEELRRLPINGQGLRLEDVAEVRYTFPEQEEFNFLNGVESLTVSVNKASTANLLAVVERVKAELAAVQELPEAEGLELRIFRDTSTDVREGLSQLRNAGLVGGLLAILAVYFFLRRFRTTLLVAVAIPVSVVATFVLMYLMRQGGLSDLTLNVVSLAGLMLALGMLVDNSVVVIESVFRHRNELDQDARTAALHGTSEVALPIVASTATTICVFLPLIFLASGGRFRLYMENIGLTVCIVMVASLVVALTVVPMVASFVLAGQTSQPERILKGMTNGYRRLLAFTLRHRLVFVLAMVFLLWGSLRLFASIERSFSGRSMDRQVEIEVDTPPNYSLAQTRELFEEIYGILDSRRQELDIADISYSYSRTGGRNQGGWRSSREFDIYLVDEEEGSLTTVEVREKIRPLLPVKAGVNLRLVTTRGRGASSGVEVQLMGPDPGTLELMARTVADRLAEEPMLRDVTTSLQDGDQEIRVTVARERADRSGLSTQMVASTISSALSSRAVSHFKTDQREVDMVMQLRPEDRRTLQQLEALPVLSGSSPLPLGALASFQRVAGPRSIERENHQSQVTVSANTASGSPSFAALGTVQRTLDSLSLPPGYSWSFGRWNRFQQQDQDSGLFALLFALPLVYMLLAALFESFAQPFTIMFSVPFALLGVAVVMKWAGQPWDTMSVIGLIVLLGVVVNNAIVLIDHINYLRQHGYSRDEAILKGGQHRLRPILITAVTTVLGLLPMVAPFLFPQWFGPVEGRAASWAPIGLVIVGGLTTSTFLTLMIIPTIYSLVDDVSRFAARVARAL